MYHACDIEVEGVYSCCVNYNENGNMSSSGYASMAATLFSSV